MPDTEHRKLRESLTELGPDAVWFLLALIGSAAAAGIVYWIPDPTAKAIVIGLGVCANALLIAWLNRLRTRDNKATTRELTILLQRIEKLQKASVAIGRQRQQREEPRQPIAGLERSRQHISGLEHRQPNVAEPLSRREFGDLTTYPRWGVGAQEQEEDVATSPRWGSGEQDAHKQWARLNAAEKAIVRFVLLRGTATAAHLQQFRSPEGFRSTDACAGVQEKTSFLVGDLEGGLTINPQLKPYLEKIIVQDKGRGARF